MNTLLEGFEASRNGHAKYWLLDGRHRICAAFERGLKELRVDVMDDSGAQGRSIVRLDEIILDPELQFIDVYRDKAARDIAINWDPQACAPLVIIPIGAMPLKRRAELKAKLDGSRNVGAIEHFKQNLLIGHSEEVGIERVLKAYGYRVGWSTAQATDITSPKVLLRMYRILGPDGFARTLKLAVQWRGDARANNANWLSALGLLVRDHYDEKLTTNPKATEKLAEVVPSRILRQAEGDIESISSSTSVAWGSIPYAAARRLRKAAGLRSLPPVGKTSLRI